jgi:hypothetical protein
MPDRGDEAGGDRLITLMSSAPRLRCRVVRTSRIAADPIRRPAFRTHVGVLRQEVGNRRDVANGGSGVEVGLGDVRLCGEELLRLHTPRRMIAVK